MFRYWYYRLTKKTGWIEDTEDSRDFIPENIPEWKLVSKSRKPNEKILDVPKILDQGPIPSCVAQMAAYGLMIEAQTKTIPSRLFLYWNSRAKHQNQKNIQMTGTRIRDCIKQLIVLGVPEEKYWEYSKNETIVNQHPPFTAYVKAHKAKNGVYCNLSKKSTRIEDIVTSICAGFPVGFGAKISKEFYEYKAGSILHKPKKEIQGGHALTIVGYSKCDNGYKFRVVNSWGTDWGEYGFCWIHEDYISSDYCKNFWIFKHGNFSD